MSEAGDRQPPHFLREPPAQLLLSADNSSASVHCVAGGHPTPTISWYRRNGASSAQPVPRSAVSSFAGTYAPSTLTSGVSVETLADASLLLSALQSDRMLSVQTGTFFCQAGNTLGTIRSRDVHVKLGTI
jgi:hypothetical protein